MIWKKKHGLPTSTVLSWDFSQTVVTIAPGTEVRICPSNREKRRQAPSLRGVVLPHGGLGSYKVRHRAKGRMDKAVCYWTLDEVSAMSDLEILAEAGK